MAFQLVKTPKPVKTIPADYMANPIVTYLDSRGGTYVITSDRNRTGYHCWRKDGTSYVKIATGDTPVVLYEFIEKEQKKVYKPIV